ncbi:MFS transporter [Opitutaceae bacterium EW11]|nr:MFS transporter [Opitutaceae bacterium EW11]
MSASAPHARYGTDPRFLGPVASRLAAKDKLKWMIALTASLGALLEVIDTSIVNVAMPEIQGNLGATLSEAGWVSTGYACANVVIIPLTAWLSNRYGRKNYLLFSLIGFTVASALCGLAPNLGTLILARVLQGLAGGGLLAKAQSILFESFPPEEQGAAQAMFGIGVIAGPAFGPVLGGYLTDTVGWRWIFFINLPVGLVAVIMALIFFPSDDPAEIRRDPVDWAGIGLLALGLGCLQTMLEEGQQDDWFSSRFILGITIVGAVSLVLFVWHELRTDSPAVDLRVLKHRSLAAGSLYSLVLGMGLYGVIFAIPVFVQTSLNFTAMQSGLLQMPGALASAVTMIVVGRKLAGKYDARFLVAFGALMMTGVAMVLSNINPNSGTHSLFLPLLFRGIGTVFMFLPLSLAALGSLPKPQVAAGAGFYNLTRQLGSSIGIAVITTVLAQREAVHRAVLVEKVNPFQPATQERITQLQAAFTQANGDPVMAHQQALSLIDRIVNGQAALLSFSDVFMYVAMAFVASLPLLLLLSKGRNRQAAEAVH